CLRRTDAEQRGGLVARNEVGRSGSPSQRVAVVTAKGRIFDFRAPSPSPGGLSLTPGREAFHPMDAAGPDHLICPGRAGPLICLGRAGDAWVVGALERVGDTLYGARVYVKLGRRLAHAHAARQSCSDSLSQLVRDRRPAKSFTFTLGPSRPARTRRPSAWR